MKTKKMNSIIIDGKLTYFSIFKERICNKIDLWKNLCCVIALFVFKNEKRGGEDLLAYPD
jgi:hypothetical protein